MAAGTVMSETSVLGKSVTAVVRERGTIRSVKDGARYGFIEVDGVAPGRNSDVFLDSRQMQEPEAMAKGVEVEFTRRPPEEVGKCDRAIDVIVVDGDEA